MLRLLSSKAQECKDFQKTPKTCHVGIHRIALTEYSQMSTCLPGFQSFFKFLHHFVLATLATSSIRVKENILCVFVSMFLDFSERLQFVTKTYC